MGVVASLEKEAFFGIVAFPTNPAVDLVYFLRAGLRPRLAVCGSLMVRLVLLLYNGTFGYFFRFTMHSISRAATLALFPFSLLAMPHLTATLMSGHWNRMVSILWIAFSGRSAVANVRLRLGTT